MSPGSTMYNVQCTMYTELFKCMASCGIQFGDLTHLREIRTDNFLSFELTFFELIHHKVIIVNHDHMMNSILLQISRNMRACWEYCRVT